MSGSRLGRGRVGRILLLGCATVILIILSFAYNLSRVEIAELKDVHVKCSQQMKALAAQLQVIYEYKIELEKTLSNEKSANAAAKEELQQKASLERSLRDKDSREALQRFNALQQNYNLLRTEHQDLKDDCKKNETVILENAKKLETTLHELRQQQEKVIEEKEKIIDNLKNKYAEIAQEKEELVEKYNELKKVTGENSGYVEHLQKQIIQLKREVEKAEKNTALKTENSVVSRVVNKANNNENNDVNNENNPAVLDNNSMQVIRPSSQHQVSSPSNEFQAGQNPQPSRVPQNYQQFDNNNANNNNTKNNNNTNNLGKNHNNNAYEVDTNNNNKNDDIPPDKVINNIRFEIKDGNVVPVGPNDVNDS